MKLKKIAAVIMMAAMIGGTGVTAYAQDAKPVTIDVQKAGETAQFQYLQLICADNSTETGWAFTSDDIAKNYRDAFGSEYSDQQLIWMLIQKADPDAKVPDGTKIIDDGQIADGIISNSRLLDEQFRRAFWLNENVEILPYGLPRNDYLAKQA